MTVRGPLIPGRDITDPWNTEPDDTAGADRVLRQYEPPPNSGKVVPDSGADGGTTTTTTTTPVTGGNVTTTTGGGGGDSGDSGTTSDTGDETDSTPAGVELNLTGATLVKVQEASGEMRYYVEYPVYGVSFRYEIGDRASFDALGPQEWPTVITLTSAEFNQRAGLDVGIIDERFGLAEDPQQTVERQLRIFGLEDIPQWQRESNEAMTILLTAADEGWSPGRALQELSKTQAFQDRFPGLNEFRSVLGDNATLSDALNAYVTMEDRLRVELQKVRGPNTNTSAEYLGTVIASGWTVTEVSQILDFERRLDQGALDNLNEILVAQGQAPVDATTLLNLARGDNDQIPLEVVETLNDALRAAELEQQGIFVGTDLAQALGEGQATSLQSVEALRSQAQAAAMDIFTNRRELDLGKFGLTEEQLLRAAFNGEASAEVESRLGQLSRERSAAAQGFDQFTSYIDERGRGRTLGIQSL